MAASGSAAASGAAGVGTAAITGVAPAPGPLYYADPFSSGPGLTASALENPTLSQQLGATPAGALAMLPHLSSSFQNAGQCCLWTQSTTSIVQLGGTPVGA